MDEFGYYNNQVDKRPLPVDKRWEPVFDTPHCPSQPFATQADNQQPTTIRFSILLGQAEFFDVRRIRRLRDRSRFFETTFDTQPDIRQRTTNHFCLLLCQAE